MILNWICLISILLLVAQLMMFFYVSAVSDFKVKKTIRTRRVSTPNYYEEYKIAK
ncbi:hypothetical protein [Alkalithermobacter paradoxus]|uniref:Uncharacterized protein n=1 Tax=Alkalithermobacter paradoxus TaxID=29349 RepID=A0A1V4I4M8_9FIRM|nr:hypothetical protein CLOTH_19530 [[Clostridium] thermoalcaliphilum]